MQPIAGFITDFIGLRLGYFLFALTWGTACALHALAGSWQAMAGFRAMLGIGESAAIPSGVKMSTNWFPPKERSIATGWFNPDRLGQSRPAGFNPGARAGPRSRPLSWAR